MKKYKKILIAAFSIVVPVSIVIGFSTNWENTISISCVGSSGVKPFVEYFGYNYSAGGFGTDVTVEAGGSGFGISQVAEGYANIGDISKDPFSNVEKDYKQQWKDRNVKTVTIAWEAMCMIYIPPKNLTRAELDLLNDSENFKLDVNASKINASNEKGEPFKAPDGSEGNMNTLYSNFSGYLDGPMEHRLSLADFVIVTDAGQNDLAYKSLMAKLEATPINPYVRTGGSNLSGTAAAFYETSHIDDAHNGLTERQQLAFEDGAYGNQVPVRETDEANSRAWDMFSKDNNAGGMVYLSSAFVQCNQELINDAGYKVMSYNGYDFNIENTTHGYEWYRPINCALSVDKNKESASMHFINWIFFGEQGSNGGVSQSYKDGLASIGGIPLTDDQIKSMSATGDSFDIWTDACDYDLYTGSSVDGFRSDKQQFGAIE